MVLGIETDLAIEIALEELWDKEKARSMNFSELKKIVDKKNAENGFKEKSYICYRCNTTGSVVVPKDTDIEFCPRCGEKIYCLK